MPEPTDSESQTDQSHESNSSERHEPQLALTAIQGVIQWLPLGGSVLGFATLLATDHRLLALLTFPATIVTAVWAGYYPSFIARLQEISRQRARSDAEFLAQMLGNINQTILVQLSGFESKYLKCQAYDCYDYKVEGDQNHHLNFTPLLNEVFVKLELVSNATSDRATRMIPIPIQNVVDQTARIAPRSSQSITEFFTRKPKDIVEEPQAIWDFLSRTDKMPSYRRMVILASVGYGKTTLLKHIALTYAENPRLVSNHKAPRLIPFLLYLRKFREAFKRKLFPTLPDLITKYHMPKLPGGENLQPPSDWVENLLKHGRALVMFDGFDEISEPVQPSVSTWISNQMKRYPKSVFILTSRPPGYKNYTAEKPLTSLFIRPLNKEQRQEFAHNWYRSQETYERGGRSTPDVLATAKQKAKNLLRQVELRAELKIMARNPLLLNMILTVHRSYPNEELPRQRASLYQDICRLQLNDRPSAKGIQLPLPGDQSQEILQSLALAMLLKQRVTTFQLSKTRDFIQRHLSNFNSDVSPEEFIEKISKISELIVEKENEIYEFAHLSIQEYLAAVHIKSLNREDLLIQHCGESQWREVILLYVAQAKNPTRIIRKICQLREDSAISLAYDCLRAASRKVAPSVRTEVQSLHYQDVENEVQELRYHTLKNYLKQSQWSEADRETYRLMIQTVEKEEGQWFDVEDLINFPPDDLRRLDSLWIRYSNNHFGFSVQRKIYMECGGTPTGEFNRSSWRTFAEKIGWRRRNEVGKVFEIDYTEVNFSLEAPRGHLPCGGVLGFGGFRLLGSIFAHQSFNTL